MVQIVLPFLHHPFNKNIHMYTFSPLRGALTVGPFSPGGPVCPCCVLLLTRWKHISDIGGKPVLQEIHPALSYQASRCHPEVERVWDVTFKRPATPSTHSGSRWSSRSIISWTTVWALVWWHDLVKAHPYRSCPTHVHTCNPTSPFSPFTPGGPSRP